MRFDDFHEYTLLSNQPVFTVETQHNKQHFFPKFRELQGGERRSRFPSPMGDVEVSNKSSKNTVKPIGTTH